MDVKDVRSDLIAEQESLDAMVAALTDEQWALATPSPRWAISDQIGHLAFFDRSAALAITDPTRFAEHRSALLSTFGNDLAVDDATLSEYRALTPADLLTAWRADREALAVAADRLGNSDRVEWYGPSMGSKSFLTARLMEAWAHGQDIADTLQLERVADDRIRHIAQLGVITRGWSYLIRQLPAPDGEVTVNLRAPSGESWTWGDPSGFDSITGNAVDFCLVVTQRRHVDDTALTVTGELARDWMTKAQAFAGNPTTGPSAGTFAPRRDGHEN